MSLNDLAREANTTAKEKGFWDNPRNFGELCTLIHSEITEAFEDYRHGRELDKVYYETGPHSGLTKPAGIPVELADVIIRVLDLCGQYGIDIDTAMKEKMFYNKKRPYRHGDLKA